MICAKCGTNNLYVATECSACGASLAPVETTELVYAGFWKRFAALFIDGLIIGLASMLIIAILGLVLGMQSGLLIGLFYLLMFGGSAYYYAMMESGEHSATYGKRWLNLRVLDVEGKRLSKGRALVRWLAHGISNITFYIGYLIQPFTERKQALHDIISSTTVVDDEPNGSSTGLIITLVVGTFVLIAVIGIIAAIAIPAYSGYVSKAHVAQAYPQGLAATQVLDRYFTANGKLPDTAAEANLPAYSNGNAALSYDTQSGQLVIEFAQGQGILAGRHLNFAPTLLIDNTLEWKCSSKDIRPEMLIAQCK